MAGFRSTQGKISLTGDARNYILSWDKRADKGGLPNGTHTFVLGFGTSKKTKKGEFMTVDELVDQSIIYDHASLFVREFGEKGQYVHWHYTHNENDPIIALGYGYESERGLIGNAKTRNEAKLNTITDGKGMYSKYLLRQCHLPVLHVPGDGTDLSSAKPAILIVTAASADAIFRQADSLKMTSKNKSIFGAYITLKKDSTQGMKAYDWRLLANDNIFTDDSISDEKKAEYRTVFEELYTSELEILEKIFTEVNGGDSNSPNEAAEKVWEYLCTVSGLSKEEFITAYSVLPNATVNPNPTVTVNFGDDEPESDE